VGTLKRTSVLLAAGALLLGAAACGSDEPKTVAGATATASTLRLGYFANVTLAGVERGTIATHLGATKLETQVCNAGPAAVEAIFAGAIDAAYLGPNPAINAYVKSKGQALRIVAGATSGGAQLVVQRSIASVADLKGKTLATPQLGNSQDVALRALLKQKDIEAEIAPSENATTLQLFKDGKIAGAWLPEPWASRLVIDGGAKVLVDERDLWPGGQFVTTHLVVATAYLEKHPDVVKRLLEAHVETTSWINANLAEAKTVVNTALEKLTQKKLATAVIDRAFANLTVTVDPVASSLQVSLDHAVAADLVKAADLHGIYDLRLLNEVLTATGKPTVADAGLGGN
jgi:NitT/TauT family transport system substrate-binding protein